MKIMVNGEDREVGAAYLDAILEELGFGAEKVATAVNETFVPKTMRGEITLEAGDRLEVVAPRQGG